MRTRSTFSFETATLEGSLFVPDRLEKFAQGALDSELPLRLPAGLAPSDEIGRSFRIATALWKDFSRRRAQANHRVVTRDFLVKFFRDALGYDLGDPAAPAAPSPDGEAPSSPLPFRLTAPDRFPIFFSSHREGLDHADRFFSGGALASRKRTVTAFAQEFLNAEDSSLWALATDGLRVRLLRDNASLTRPCWLEFDLERILSEERYPDYAVLWRVLYHSRVGLTPDAKSSDWETLRKTGIEEGVRVRDKLRDGIATALERLGTGFLRAPGSAALREALDTGSLNVEMFRRELLRLAYRLLFLFVAEERDLLHAPEADAAARRRYAAGYSLRRLTRRSRRVSAADASFFDLWDSLRIVFRLLGGSGGSPDGEAPSSPANPLGLPELGGLFSADRCPFLDAAALDNASLLGAIRDLRWTVQGGATQAVDYRNMGAEEFGSIYESLLEMVPAVSLPRREFSFAGPAAGNARKTSASYYTPAPLVDRLVKSALDPLIEKALASKDPEAALLALAVLDPACGSGHFSLAAGRRIAEALARVRAGEGGTVTPALYRAAFRDVISHCLYGVDLNPMAVELAKIALWIESVEPGKPLTFLDSHFVCGNSVLGVMDLKVLSAGIPAAAYDALDGDDKELCKALKKKNAAAIKQRRETTTHFGQKFAQQLNLLDPGSNEADLASRFETIDAMPERSMAEVRAKESAYFELLFHAKTGPESEAANLYLAAFLLPKHAGRPIPTSADVFGALGFPGFAPPSEELHLAARDVCAVARTLHWPIIFPAVFARGGFDCALTNPPWDQIQFNPREWFAARDAEIATARNMAEREKKIARLKEVNPFLFRLCQTEGHIVATLQSFIHGSGRFPKSSQGRLNLAPVFLETVLTVVSQNGRAGIIIPSGIASDSFTQDLFRSLVDSNRIESLFDFENTEGIFPAVHRMFKFCLLTLGRAQAADFAFFLHNLMSLADVRRHFTLTSSDFALLNPNTRTCPVFRSTFDAELTKKIYHRIPVLVDESKGDEGNTWFVSFMLMFMMNTASRDFETSSREGVVPVFEGKMIEQFDHRWARFTNGDEVEFLSQQEKTHSDIETMPRYWMPKQLVEQRVQGHTQSYFLGWRKITNATNARTTITSVLPFCAAGDSLLLFFSARRPSLQACLLADFNSIVRDWVARQKIGGVNFNFFTMKQLPTLPPSAYTQADIDYIVPRVLELTYTSHSLKPWAEDLGFAGEPFRWDEDRRALLRAELDSRYARLYGLTRDELRYILDPADLLGPDYPSETFRVLKEKELATFHEYRTQRLVLEAWDAQEANT